MMVSSTRALLIMAIQLVLVVESDHTASYITINSSVLDTTLAGLLDLKHAISNDPTNFLAPWNTSMSPDFCVWPGIYCSNGTHNVVALLLDSNQLTGSLPPQLSQLSHLAYLNVSNNSLTGPIPSQFGELSSLTHLDLSFNHLIGSIPSSLANCTVLQYLDFRNNSLSGKLSAFLTSLNHLVYLDLSVNSFFGEQLPPDIGRLSNLQFLQLFESGLTGSLPSSITNCTSLVWLHLKKNNLTGPLPADWSKFSRILRIHLQNNLFTGSIPATLGNCSTLLKLDLSSNLLTGELPEALGQLALLQDLVLYYNGISGVIPTSLVNCTVLLSLQLGYNNLSGTIPADMGRLKHALFLGFGGNPQISGRIPETIGECAKLQVWSTGFTELGGLVPSSLYNLSSLQILRLSSNRFSGTLFEDVKNLTALEKLVLDGNTFRGRLPAGLGALTELQELDLHHNLFEGPIPQLWHGNALVKVDLSFNFLTGVIPTAIGQFQHLNNLYLQNNCLSGDIPDVFVSLTGLLNLNLSHNKLTGTVPRSLHVSVSLDLSFNQLTGSIPISIGNMRMVTTIKLAGNHLTGAIPDTLGQCQGLEVLDLSVNNLGGEIPSALGSLVVLENLDLSHNNLDGGLPQSVGALHDLVSLNVSYNALEGMIPNVVVYQNSSAAAFLGNPHLCGYPLNKSCSSHSHHSSRQAKTVLIVSICATASGLLMLLVCICICRRCSSYVANNTQPQFGLRKWTARELRAATNGFDKANVIGSGGVSVCYKGMVETVEGTMKSVAIKRLSMTREAKKSFGQELKTFCNVRHRNLVRTLGYCMDEEVVALILEFMEKGNLDEHLHSESKSLSWRERLRVASDVAEGLVYLHHECCQPIIHCDLKPANILLGPDMVAKISDFGIAKFLDSNQTLSTRNFRGTFGYVAPECAAGLWISTKADVYSYGVLLIELVTGMQPRSPQLHARGINLHTWAREILQPGHNIEASLIDTTLQGNIAKDPAILQHLEGLLDLGAKCTNNRPKERPNMRYVQQILSQYSQATYQVRH